MTFAATHNAAPQAPPRRGFASGTRDLSASHWLCDTSPKGLRNSYGFMANYLYALDDIENNVEEFARAGVVSASSEVTKLLDGAK